MKLNDNNVINVFISSANRDVAQTPFDFTVTLPNNLVVAKQGQGIKVNVISFDMMNTMYNVNNNNNTIIFTKAGANTTIQLTNGNYNVNTFMALLKSTFTTNTYTLNVSYNSAQNTFTYSNTSPTVVYAIRPVNSGQLLGLTNNQTYTLAVSSGFTGSYINMVQYNKIILRSPTLNYDVSSIENLRSKDLEISSILFWTSKQDIEPFKVIRYNNEDAGNSYCYNLYNKEVNSLQLLLEDEWGYPIKDAPNYHLGLQFIIYNRDDNKTEELLSLIQVYMKDIYFLLLWFMEYLRII